MADATEKSPLELFAERLIRYGVEFVVIGGQAETLFGSPRVTFDTDICYRRTEANLGRLAAMLKELGVTLRGAPADLPFRIDARSLALGLNFTFASSLGDFDLLGEVEPLGGYDALVLHAETIQVGDLDVKVIGLDDLILVKQHIKRVKDQESLLQLTAIKKMRDERGPKR